MRERNIFIADKNSRLLCSFSTLEPYQIGKGPFQEKLRLNIRLRAH